MNPILSKFCGLLFCGTDFAVFHPAFATPQTPTNKHRMKTTGKILILWFAASLSASMPAAATEKSSFTKHVFTPRHNAITIDSARLAASNHSSGKITAEKKGKRWLPEILERQSFGIEITRMFTPGGIVNLSHPGLFLLKSGRMQANLPYIGRFRAPNLAIAHKRTVDIDAPAIDYKVYSTRRGFRVRYKIFQVGENFDVEIRINRNGYATVYIYSSLRSDIRYSGEVKMLRF